MAMTSNNILAQARSFVSPYLIANLPQWAVYHTLAHTEETVAAAEEIAEACKLGKQEKEIVFLAAWFHDIGYVETVEGHEEKGVEIATRFLQENDYPQQKIDQVAGCIRATKMPQSPTNVLEEVLCDADLMHLGKKRFFDKSQLLRTEIELRTGKPFSDVEWLEKNIKFVSMGRYHTQCAREAFSARRNKNLIELQDRLRELLEKKARKADNKLEKTKSSAGKQEKVKKPERGIETMFRVVPKNHLDLSGLADQKASMLIGVTGTIMAIVISVLSSKFDTHPYLAIPTLVLIATCLATMIFAILATRPNVTSGTFTRDDIHQRKVNLLFFGNFHKSSLEDFDWAMREMMDDSDYLYGSMIKDLYFLGKVLGVKYHYLRIAYNVFMWGLIVSVAAFAIAWLTAPAPVPLPVG